MVILSPSRCFLRTNFYSIRTISQSRATSLSLKPNYGPMEFQRSEMMNGTRIAATKTMGAQMAACTIMFQAGSRFEINDDFGATHFIRANSSGSGCGFTSFSKMRTLQHNGSYMTCTTDRQTVAFTLRCPLQFFPDLKYYLLDTATRSCNHEWEISDRKPLVKDDLFRLTPEQRVVDLVQKACWAGPLANSMYCEEGRVDAMTGEILNDFMRKNFITTNCTVASVGVPFDETLKLAEKIESRREKPQGLEYIPSQPRSGFEYHDLGAGSDTWIAVAIPGCGTYDLSSLMRHAIIAEACGTGNMQMGQHNFDRIPQPPLGLMSGGDFFTDYKAFNISYRETGVFGIMAKTRSCTANRAAFAVVEFLSNIGDLTFKQIEIGKKRLQLNIALHEEDCVNMSEGLALQLANNAQMDSVKDTLAMVDMITPDEVTCAAKNLASKRKEMAVAIIGDVGVVPTDKELFNF